MGSGVSARPFSYEQKQVRCPGHSVCHYHLELATGGWARFPEVTGTHTQHPQKGTWACCVLSCLQLLWGQWWALPAAIPELDKQWETEESA